MTTGGVRIGVETGSALAWQGDVLVVKFAQRLYGVDAAVHAVLSRAAPPGPLPDVGASLLQGGTPGLGAARVVFLGVPRQGVFGYADVRDFGHRALSAAGVAKPAARHVALTLQGIGFGLDETEAFEAELAGIVDAVEGRDMPAGLATVTFVERNAGRAGRMAAVLARLLPGGRIGTAGSNSGDDALDAAARATLRGVGRASAAKPKVFVAMPFAPDMDDVFHHGIQGAVNAAGLPCERADLASFTGDVVEWVKARIAAARLVIADLSTANPNVYLEVGYAWGKGVLTVLLARAGLSHELQAVAPASR